MFNHTDDKTSVRTNGTDRDSKLNSTSRLRREIVLKESCYFFIKRNVT
jgi:hypothetical protein